MRYHKPLRHIVARHYARPCLQTVWPLKAMAFISSVRADSRRPGWAVPVSVYIAPRWRKASPRPVK